MRKPGLTGTFGRMTFSHDLIHIIGGEDDTNRNLTQRLLLLLESVVVGGNAQAYNRVITNILQRYIPEEEQTDKSGWLSSVPRFLLNDVARLWRTMAVDFATKQWERQGEDWGLRAAKLAVRSEARIRFRPLDLLSVRFEADRRVRSNDASKHSGGRGSSLRRCPGGKHRAFHLL